MSKAFEQALNNHPMKHVNYLEFRRIWAPVFLNYCRSAESYFPQESNQFVPSNAVAMLIISNVSLGQELLGIAEYDRFLAMANDAAKKFNLKATSSDPAASKVLSALTEALNQGQYR